MVCSVRVVTPSDTPAILALVRRVYAEQGLTLYLEDEPHWLTPGPTFRAQGGDFWVLDEDGSVRGTVAVAIHPDHAEIKCLYLDLAARGQGWGRRLVEHAVAFLRHLRHGRIVLWSDTRFVDARAFYRRLGFQETGALRGLDDRDNTIEREFVMGLPCLSRSSLARLL